MVCKEVSKDFWFRPGITCTCYAIVPDLEVEPEELGKDLEKKYRTEEEILENWIYPQATRRMKAVLESYEMSELPKKFLVGQKIVLYPISDFRCLGSYISKLDIILLDSDAFSIGVRGGSGAFLYGHECGHRIMHFRKSALKTALEETKSLLMISDEHMAEEVLCDAFGELLDYEGYYEGDIIGKLNRLKRKGLERIALKLAYS